jgi:chemotaxis regulatin CheY-phosphate phosphatase CheZ
MLDLFSKERYEQEVQLLKRKEEKAFEKRLELQRAKEMAEDMEIALRQVGSASAKFDPDHF